MAQEFTPQYTFKEDRLNELKQLFPEAWGDGVFNVDTLKELIGEFSTDNTVKEHFGLNWVGKQDARRIAAKPPTGTLKPCIGEGVNEDTTENIFIEGENLEVLKILRKSYIGKVKMIYIDPPYNTGNDFIYNDTFADSTEDYLRKTGEKSDDGLLVSNPKSSGKYHANWLSFMYPRLRLAKDLLKDDGVVFISIDDNEIDNLRLLCDEILGEENFYSQTIIRANSRGQTYKQIAKTHEYLLMYTKNPDTDLFELEKDGDSTDLNLTDDLGDFSIRELRNRNPKFGKHNRPNLFYPIYINTSKIDKDGFFPVSIKNEIDFEVSVEPFNSLGKESCWRWGKPKCIENINLETLKSNLIAKQKNDGSYGIYEKYRKTTYKPKSIWDDNKFLTETGTVEVKKLGFTDEFDFPKPVELIKQCINLSTEENDIVMDFFAGSGTTAQAVLESNQKKIKFICVQIPALISEKHSSFDKGYKNISNVTKERIRRAINIVDETKGFKVYKQNNSTIYKWQEFVPEQDGALPDLFSKMELAYKNPLQDGVTTQDFITEVILQEGFPLTATQEEVASGIFKITHEWVPYTLYATMLYSFKNTDFETLPLEETDHFVCLDKAFDGNDALKQSLDNTCKLYTI